MWNEIGRREKKAAANCMWQQIKRDKIYSKFEAVYWNDTSTHPHMPVLHCVFKITSIRSVNAFSVRFPVRAWAVCTNAPAQVYTCSQSLVCQSGSAIFASHLALTVRFGLWLLPKRTNHHHSEMHSLTQILTNTRTLARTHTNALCVEMNAHLCARGPFSLCVRVCLNSVFAISELALEKHFKAR